MVIDSVVHRQSAQYNESPTGVKLVNELIDAQGQARGREGIEVEVMGVIDIDNSAHFLKLADLGVGEFVDPFI